MNSRASLEGCQIIYLQVVTKQPTLMTLCHLPSYRHLLVMGHSVRNTVDSHVTCTLDTIQDFGIA